MTLPVTDRMQLIPPRIYDIYSFPEDSVPLLDYIKESNRHLLRLMSVELANRAAILSDQDRRCMFSYNLLALDNWRNEEFYKLLSLAIDHLSLTYGWMRRHIENKCESIADEVFKWYTASLTDTYPELLPTSKELERDPTLLSRIEEYKVKWENLTRSSPFYSYSSTTPRVFIADMPIFVPEENKPKRGIYKQQFDQFNNYSKPPPAPPKEPKVTRTNKLAAPRTRIELKPVYKFNYSEWLKRYDIILSSEDIDKIVHGNLKPQPWMNEKAIEELCIAVDHDSNINRKGNMMNTTQHWGASQPQNNGQYPPAVDPRYQQQMGGQQGFHAQQQQQWGNPQMQQQGFPGQQQQQWGNPQQQQWGNPQIQQQGFPGQQQQWGNQQQQGFPGQQQQPSMPGVDPGFLHAMIANGYTSMMANAGLSPDQFYILLQKGNDIQSINQIVFGGQPSQQQQWGNPQQQQWGNPQQQQWGNPQQQQDQMRNNGINVGQGFAVSGNMSGPSRSTLTTPVDQYTYDEDYVETAKQIAAEEEEYRNRLDTLTEEDAIRELKEKYRRRGGVTVINSDNSEYSDDYYIELDLYRKRKEARKNTSQQKDNPDNYHQPIGEEPRDPSTRTYWGTRNIDTGEESSPKISTGMGIQFNPDEVDIIPIRSGIEEIPENRNQAQYQQPNQDADRQPTNGGNFQQKVFNGSETAARLVERAKNARLIEEVNNTQSQTNAPKEPILMDENGNLNPDHPLVVSTLKKCAIINSYKKNGGFSPVDFTDIELRLLRRHGLNNQLDEPIDFERMDLEDEAAEFERDEDGNTIFPDEYLIRLENYKQRQLLKEQGIDPNTYQETQQPKGEPNTQFKDTSNKFEFNPDKPAIIDPIEEKRKEIKDAFDLKGDKFPWEIDPAWENWLDDDEMEEDQYKLIKQIFDSISKVDSLSMSLFANLDEFKLRFRRVEDVITALDGEFVGQVERCSQRITQLEETVNNRMNIIEKKLNRVITLLESQSAVKPEPKEETKTSSKTMIVSRIKDIDPKLKDQYILKHEILSTVGGTEMERSQHQIVINDDQKVTVKEELSKLDMSVKRPADDRTIYKKIHDKSIDDGNFPNMFTKDELYQSLLLELNLESAINTGHIKYLEKLRSGYNKPHFSTVNIIANPTLCVENLDVYMSEFKACESFKDLAALGQKYASVNVNSYGISDYNNHIMDILTTAVNEYIRDKLHLSVTIDKFQDDIVNLKNHLGGLYGPNYAEAIDYLEILLLASIKQNLPADSLEYLRSEFEVPEDVYMGILPMNVMTTYLDLSDYLMGYEVKDQPQWVDEINTPILFKLISAIITTSVRFKEPVIDTIIVTSDNKRYKVWASEIYPDRYLIKKI